MCIYFRFFIFHTYRVYYVQYDVSQLESPVAQSEVIVNDSTTLQTLSPGVVCYITKYGST